MSDVAAPRILMTGATGFIGRRALPALAARAEVHCVSRRPPREAEGARWHSADLRDHAQIQRLVEEIRPTHLLHLAWETTHGSYYTTPDNVRWLEDSLQLLDSFIRTGGRRIVCAGSAAEYDLTTTGDLSEHTTPLRPNGLYGECKKALSEVVARYATDSGVESAWGRVFFCYGPGEAPSRTVPTLITSLLRSGRVAFQDGRGIRDYVHVDDVAEGFVLLSFSSVSGAVNLASGHPVSLRDLVQLIARETGGVVDLGTRPTPPYEPARVVADVTRARTELGWRPRRTLEDGIRETVAWWRSRIASENAVAGSVAPPR